MTDDTARLSLPLLHVAQAQKEMTHNEALTRIDLLLHGCVTGVAEDTPPAAPDVGQCWIVGDTPTGAWAGRTGQVAGWTAGGWRFVVPRDGMTLWWAGGETTATFRGTRWHPGEVRAARLVIGGTAVVGAQQPEIIGPAGGISVDSECRAVLERVLDALRGHGLIAG